MRITLQNLFLWLLMLLCAVSGNVSGHDVKLTAAQNTSDKLATRREDISGVYSSGGFSWGNNEQDNQNTLKTVTNTGSVIGATSGIRRRHQHQRRRRQRQHGQGRYPLAAFKSQLRTRAVNERGIKTNIGAKSGQLGWGEVRSIEYADECIYIVRKNYNSYIVPRRAFSSEGEMGQFLASITAWHGAHG